MSPRSSSGTRRALLLTGAVAAALTLNACGGGDGDLKSGGGTNFVTGKSGIATVAPADRKPAGAIAGKTLTGEQFDVADLKGKVVVLNVWGSWCGPCRAEAPHFAKVSKELKKQGVEFVGLNVRDPNENQAVQFEKNFRITYPSLHDPAGKLLVNGFPKGTLNPQTIPTTIALDREGRIAARSMAALGEDKLREMIDPLVAEKASGQAAGKASGQASAQAAGKLAEK
ncbi:TlpA family protein disulfide reductase [Streptomyces lichenis]|uniref:TlpA family protein disulfide reductase n=1 Tax=Streptomyces lichenis TaxID=2306967 RepID=A0ABT0IIN7_9ACTN|nr:TlpA disulfide reductase family protein [Streptomyces lichenis]MCK8681166.1 TlpA family protein disulfide reductase [Streptomyces lichenis]